MIVMILSVESVSRSFLSSTFDAPWTGDGAWGSSLRFLNPMSLSFTTWSS